MTSGIGKARDLGDIVGEMYKVYKTNFLRLIAIVAIVEVVLLALDFIGRRLIVPFDATNPDEWVAAEWGQFVVWLIITVLFFFILYTLRQGALIKAITEQYTKQPVDIGKAYSLAWRRIGALLGATLLAGIAVGAMAITIIGIPFAIYFGIRWSFILQTVILESKSPTQALSRSSDLVKNTWWRVFGVSIIIALIVGGISAILSFTLGLVPYVGSSLVTILTTPIVVIGGTILYYDLVFRKEGYRPEMMAR